MMQPGRRPTPTNLRVLRGNPGHRPVPKEPKPTKLAQCPDPPAFLEDYAAEEWNLVAPELHSLGLLTTVDKASLAAYCYNYGQWRTAAEALKKMAANDLVFHGLLVKRESAVVQNPLVYIARKAAAEMVRYAAEFGFTPAARSRIAAGVDNQEPRRFAGLLAG
jgi:P27 family predicted phage terminase small subunit